jgi:hypothetical protein
MTWQAISARPWVLDALAGHGGGSGGGGGGGGGGGSGEASKCKVCMERPVQTCLKPCGHSLMCLQCAETVKQCPICRRPIEEAIRWFPTW